MQTVNLEPDIPFLLANPGIPSDSNYTSLESRNEELVVDEKPEQFRQYCATIAATLSVLGAGMVLAWTSPIQKELLEGHYRGIKLNNSQVGWMGSFATVGAMIMCIPVGFICDLIGRKKTLLLLIFPFTIGWLLILFAENVFMLYFGRLINGLAVGASCIGGPLYTNEIAHKSIRGALGSYFQLMLTIGIFIAYLTGKYLTPMQFTILCICIPFVFVLVFAFQPETPTYLFKTGRYDEGKLILIKLRGQSYDVDSEVNEIQGSLKENTQIAVSIVATLRKKWIIKAFLISSALYFFQQFCGVTAIIFYTSHIFQLANTGLEPQTCTIIVGAFQVIATFFSSLMVDRWGRRVLLFISSFIVMLSLFQLAIYFTIRNRSDLPVKVIMSLGFIPVVSLCLFIIAFSFGLGPVAWIVGSEMYPPEIKSIASSVSATFNWLMAFLITKLFPTLVEIVDMDSLFYFFGVCSAVGTIFIYFFVPETKGKTISEIETTLEN